MRVMDELSEAAQRRTPSFQYAGGQSPRVGSSCASAVYHLIDWNLSKRFSSTKRIVADRPNHDGAYSKRDASFSEQARAASPKVPVKVSTVSSSSITPSVVQSTASPASVKSDATSKRSPGVVARLMGLESLPERPKSGTPPLPPPLPPPLGPPPVLLQELIRLELQQSKKSLKDKLPSFTKSKPVVEAETRGAKKKPAGAHRVRPYENSSRALRPSPPEKSKPSPFLARLQQTSLSPNPLSPILSPLGGRSTVKLLAAAVKALEPPAVVPRRKYNLTITDTSQSESFRSERRPFTASSRPASKPERRSRSTSLSGNESNSSPGSRRYESRRELSRTRFDTPPVASSSRSVSPLPTHRSKRVEGPIRPKRVEDPAPPLLRSHEASIREFKTDLSDSPVGKKLKTEISDTPVGKKLKRNDSQPQLVELPLPSFDLTSPSEPLASDVSSPSVAPEKSRGFRSIRFRSRSGKDQKKLESPEKSVAPSPPFSYSKRFRKQAEDSIASSPSKVESVDSEGSSSKLRSRKHEGDELREALTESSGLSSSVAGAGFGSHMLSTKQGSEPKAASLLSPAKGAKVASAGVRKAKSKIEGNETGEALAMKRTDSTWMRSLLRRPSSMPWTSKASKKMNVEVTERVEPSAAHEPISPSQEPALHSPTLQPARYRSIDDVFPELPMEEKNACSLASPELTDTIRAVEELQLLRQTDADYRSIERMFGKEFSRTLMAAELTSPEMSPVPESSPESRVPGTFPNSPKFKTMSAFSSRNQLNLHDMFEVVSVNDCSGRRRSFRLTEPRERALEAEKSESETTCSNLTPEHRESDISSVAAGGMTPRALREFEEQLANEDVMSSPTPEESVVHGELLISTPPALKKFEEELAQEEITLTPPALKKFEEELAEEEIMLTPPALKKFEEKLADEAGMTTPPSSEKSVHEGVMTPPALKKFEEKLAQGFSNADGSHILCPEEFGQPSPVSVLQSPFLDEVPTTPEASLAEAQLNGAGDTEPSATEEDDEDEANKNTATSKVAMPEVIQTEMIEQVMLDISRIRSIDATSIGLQAQPCAPAEPQQEENYIREVLNASRVGYSAMDLFNRLEFSTKKQRAGLRSERRLVFDSVQEVMALEPWLKTSSFYVDLPMFPALHANSKFRSPICGEELVHEVHRMICHWKDIAGHCLDDLIDYDMNVPEGRWVKFSHEVADVGLDIERSLLQHLIAEVVDELISL